MFVFKKFFFYCELFFFFQDYISCVEVWIEYVCKYFMVSVGLFLIFFYLFIKKFNLVGIESEEF